MPGTTVSFRENYIYNHILETFYRLPKAEPATERRSVI